MVLDASALVELLLQTPAGREVALRIADPAIGLHVPHLADVEVAQALRRYASDGELNAAAAAVAIDDLHALDVQRHAHEPLLDRVWALRQNLSAYDAVLSGACRGSRCEVVDLRRSTGAGSRSVAPGPACQAAVRSAAGVRWSLAPPPRDRTSVDARKENGRHPEWEGRPSASAPLLPRQLLALA